VIKSVDNEIEWFEMIEMACNDWEWNGMIGNDLGWKLE
jgi:hypothetical protein